MLYLEKLKYILLLNTLIVIYCAIFMQETVTQVRILAGVLSMYSCGVVVSPPSFYHYAFNRLKDIIVWVFVTRNNNKKKPEVVVNGKRE